MANKINHLNSLEKQKIKEYYLSGKSIKKIANLISRSSSTVHNSLKKQKIKIRKFADYKIPSFRKGKYIITKDQEKEIVDAYLSGLTLTEVIESLHRKDKVVYRTLKKYNIKPRKTTDYKDNIATFQRLNQKEVDKIIYLYFDKHLRVHEVAKKSGHSTSSVSKYLRLSKRKIRSSFDYGENRNEVARRKMKLARAKYVFPIKDTKIEVKIQNFLKNLGIEFYTHQYIKEIEHSYQCDIMIPVQKGINQKTIIECDGDYWHDYPNGKEKDHLRTKELQEKGWRVIRLWEREIKRLKLNELSFILGEK
jgi:very-short-patch-repair endonuclease/transposase